MSRHEPKAQAAVSCDLASEVTSLLPNTARGTDRSPDGEGGMAPGCGYQTAGAPGGHPEGWRPRDATLSVYQPSGKGSAHTSSK